MEPTRGRRILFSAQAIATALVSIVCVLLVGCGSNLAQVSGVVTLDGEPLCGGDGIHATVYFQPASGEGATAVGLLDEKGVYRLSSGSQQGVAPGEYVVSFTATRIIPSKTPGGTPSGKRISDPKYASTKTSGIRFAVQMGDNECDIPLESSPEPTSRIRRR